MKNYFFALTLLMIILASCGSSPVSVSYSSSFCKEHVVKVDDTMTLKTDSGTQYVKKTMKSGKHTLTIDGGKPVSFEIHDESILNLAHQEFVVFPIEFKFGEESEMQAKLNAMSINENANMLIIDSFVVGNTHIIGGIDSTWNRSRIVREVKNSEYTELRKTDSNQLVVDKIWDIGIGDEIPKSVKSYVSKGSKTASTTRKKIMDARLFVLYASISGEYGVKSLTDYK